MKTIHKSLMALLTALVFMPSLSAQSVNREKYQLVNGIGYNKYLLSDKPNENGEYILRLETFATGDVKELAIPTDFVFVLDGSGSMLYDAPVPGIAENERPLVIDGDDARFGMRYANASDGLRYYAYNGIYRHATWDSDNKVWSNGEGGYNFPQPFSETSLSSRYYYSQADKTYYRILRGSGKDDEGHTYYYLYFNRSKKEPNDGGGIWYVYSNSSGKMATSQASYNSSGTRTKEPYQDVPYFKKITSTSQIIVAPSVSSTIDYSDSNADNSWARHFFRPQQRREALIAGLDMFIEQIAQENAKDSKWAENVTRHRIAMVSFTGRYNDQDNKDNIKASTNTTSGSSWDDDVIGASPENSTRVLKAFAQITESNKQSYKNVARNSIRNSGGAGTKPNQGLRLARLLLEAEQVKANMAPLNADGSINRNKVVVFFTDGTPQGFSNANDVVPESSLTLSGVSGTIYASFWEAKKIKAVRTSPTGKQINAQLFSVDYSHNEEAVPLLSYLSSNYPDGDYTLQTGDVDNNAYTGTAITPESSRIYYQDATAIDLSNVFKQIADASIGDGITSHMAVVDKLTDSFYIPSNLSGKVKFYTAQCIGKKTIDGSEYLAFAQDIQVPNRPALGVLWVNDGDADWQKKTNLDIDNNITYKVTDDHKSIIVNGFNFSQLWCGLDEAHLDNTRQTPITQNASYALDGYRGFKFILEFPIKLESDVVGGLNIDTNLESSGLYGTNNTGTPIGTPIINYPVPNISIPITLIIQKTGLKVGESASFTVQRKKRTGSSDYEDYASFVLTGDSANTPEVKLLNLDPEYYYRVKETGWSWSYTSNAMSTFPTTENPDLKNPIVIKNNLKDTDLKHAEAKATNVLQSE